MKTYRTLYDNPIFTEKVSSDSAWTIRQAKNGTGFSVKPCFFGIRVEASYGKTMLEALKGLRVHLETDIDLLKEKLEDVNREIAEIEASPSSEVPT